MSCRHFKSYLEHSCIYALVAIFKLYPLNFRIFIIWSFRIIKENTSVSNKMIKK